MEPGFDSRYRYHTRCNTGHLRDDRANPGFPFKPIGSCYWRKPERAGEHFSQESASVLHVLRREQGTPGRHVIVDVRDDGVPIETFDVRAIAGRDGPDELVALSAGGPEFLQQLVEFAGGRNGARQIPDRLIGFPERRLAAVQILRPLLGGHRLIGFLGRAGRNASSCRCRRSSSTRSGGT
jgi:hypothetical protein